MELPSIRYIISRIVFLAAIVVGAKFGYGFYKTEMRKRAIATELQSITSDSTFFHQFYAADAHKTLIRAIGLMAEGATLGMTPDKAIDRGLGIKTKFFENDADHEEPPAREKIIRACLRGNYENFLKLGYTPDLRIAAEMKNGELPPIPSGPEAGRKPVIANLIPPSLSPGLEKVVANLEIRPPQHEERKMTDIEIATAKELAGQLAEAQVIEESVRDRIKKALSQQ